jgi:hypothetical protein
MADYSIALQNKPMQVTSQEDYLKEIYALQNAQQANQLNKMVLGEKQRGFTEDEAVKNALRNLDRTSPTFAQDEEAAYAIKGIEGLKALGAQRKERMLAKKAQFETMVSQKDFDNQARRDLSFNSSDENVKAYAQDAVLKGVYTQEEADRAAAQLLAIPVEQRKAFLSSQGAKASDLITKPSGLATLQNELAALPLNDPRRAAYEDAIRKETLSADMQAYETAKKQGFTGSLFDYKRQLAKAGSPTSLTKIDNFEPASVAAQKEYVAEVRVTRGQLKNVKGTLDSIEKAKALVPTAKGFMGPGGEALLKASSFLNNRLGTNIDVKGITDATELRTRLFGNIMENLKKMDAQPSQMQQIIMHEALGNLGTDPNAMNDVLDAYADMLKGKVAEYNQDVTDAEARGVKFPYKPQIDLGIPANRNAVTPAGKNPHAGKTDAQIKKELGII